MASTVKNQAVKSESNGQPQNFAVLSSCNGENMKNLLSQKEMDYIINGDYENVMAVLGIHRDKGSKEVFIRAYKPKTQSIELLDGNGNSLGMMTKLDERGFYQINLGVTDTDNFKHKFRITNDKNETYEEEDMVSRVWLFRYGLRMPNVFRWSAHSIIGTDASMLCVNIITAAYGIFLFRTSARVNSTNTKSRRRKIIF